MLTGRDIQQARTLMKWTQGELARRSSLPVSVIGRAEVSEGEALITVAQQIAIKGTLFTAGIAFTADGPKLDKGSA